MGVNGRPLAWLLAVACVFMPASARAQTVTATVTGIVRDASGAIVPGATVEIRNHDTNQVWSGVSDDRGRFRLLYLPPGNYHLSAQLSGFTTANANLMLAVNDQIDVPLVLKPAAVSEAVEVAAAPLVEAARTEVAAALSRQEVDTLPLNGRNYLDLALLAPNVSRTNLRTTDRYAETTAVPGTGVSVAGQRNLNNTFVIDGLSANDDAADLAGTYLSQEVVREFQVVTSGGGAEFGRASAGTVSVVTQSGTNTNSGRVYEYFRNNAFDEPNPLAIRKDPLNQNQFGASFGGPIARDRTFWFANAERAQQDRTGIVTIAPASVLAVNSVLDQAGYRGPRITTGNFPTGYTTTNVFGRLDHQAGAHTRLQARYNFYDVTSGNARNVSGLNDISRGTALDDTDQMFALGYMTTFSPHTIDEARLQYIRSRLAAPVNDLIGPAVNISGVASFGTSTSSPTARNADVIEATDTVTLQRASHLVKAGVDVLYNRVLIDFPGALQGAYTFTNLATFQRGVYSQFQQAFGQTSLSQDNPNVGVFVQDQWRPRGDVTLDLGLRYDAQLLPDPIAFDGNNLSPRAGIAYAPGSGQMVIRASGGIYFDRIPLRATSNAIQRDGTKYQTAVLSFGQAGAPAWPAVLPAFPAGVLVSITNINPQIQNQRNEQGSVQFERAAGAHLSAQVGYSYVRGHGIIMSHNVNVPTLTAAQAALLGVSNLGRPDSRYGNISQYDSLGDSWAHAMSVSVETRRWTLGHARVSYTLSKSEDTSGNAFFQTPQTQNDILAERGPSDNDQRHRLVVSGTIDRGLAGFQVGWVYAYASPLPFNIVTGADNNNDTTVNDRPAGVGRNSGRYPCFDDLTQTCGSTTTDLRLSRIFDVHKSAKLELMVEAFNVFNRANVVNVNNTIGNTATPSPTFKQVTAVADMRQLQLGVRCTF